MWLRRRYKGDDDLINLDKVIRISKDGSAVIRFFSKMMIIKYLFSKVVKIEIVIINYY